MNLQELEKIESLVRSSPILSAQERVEWLQLLGLMDDKQLGELEKILASASTPKILNAKFQMPNAPQKPAIAPSQIPHLSHILNLPNNLEQKPAVEVKPFFPLKQSPAPILSAVTTKNPPEPKDSKFLGKLKSIFSEKELTTSRPETPLELAAAALQMPVRKPQATPEPSLPKAVRPQVLKPAPPLPPKPKTAPAPLADPDKPAVLKQVASPGFRAGINFPQTSEKLKIKELADIKGDDAGQKNNTPRPSMPAMGKEPVFEKLDDIAGLDFKVFESSDINSLAAKIKSLVKGFGYFDVIFNLEKSPMFKSYVATGVKALSETSDFDGLAAASPKVGQYLNREQFEKFTDLLTKIQSS